MSRTKAEFTGSYGGSNYDMPRGWPKPSQDYADHLDMQAAKRIAKKMTPEMIAEFMDDGLVVVPAHILKKAFK